MSSTNSVNIIIIIITATVRLLEVFSFFLVFFLGHALNSNIYIEDLNLSGNPISSLRVTKCYEYS